MRFNVQPITGVDISGTEMPILAPIASNSLSVTGSIGNPIATHGLNYGYNATNWEFIRNNVDVTLMGSASVSATTQIAALNYNHVGAMFFMNVTGNFPPGSASTTIALKVRAVAPDGNSVFITGTTAKSISGMTMLTIYPGLSETVGVSTSKFNGILPRNFLVIASISTAAASVGFMLSLGLSFVL